MCHDFKHPKKNTLLDSYESQNNKQAAAKKVHSIHTKQITAWEWAREKAQTLANMRKKTLTISNISIYSAHLSSTLRQYTALTTSFFSQQNDGKQIQLL